MIENSFEKRKTRLDPKLYDLVEIDLPEAVLREVQAILQLVSPAFDTSPVTSAFHMVIRVFKGDHPAYRACNTHYHDLRHTTDAFLAMARLIHGACLNGEAVSERRIDTSLIAALFHDTGYIQEKRDTEGTGAKYTLSHVTRSVSFLERYGADFGLSEQDIFEGAAMITCTDVSREIPLGLFFLPIVELLGRLLNAADLVAQMADRTYLEKLLFLYHEYKEGGVGDYESEVDLLKKTIGFYQYIEKRLDPVSEKVNLFLISHFSSRWGIRRNLYAESIEGQREYLRNILAIPGADPRDHLHRYGVLEKVRAIHGPA